MHLGSRMLDGSKVRMLGGGTLEPGTGRIIREISSVDVVAGTGGPMAPRDCRTIAEYRAALAEQARAWHRFKVANVLRGWVIVARDGDSGPQRSVVGEVWPLELLDITERRMTYDGPPLRAVVGTSWIAPLPDTFQ